MKCKAAIATGKGNFIIDEVVINNPLEYEVLVRIKSAGICHTDYDSLSWNKPLVMGHEGAGIIEMIGNNVKDLQLGDSVILNWATPCEHCYQCMKGNQHLCENNSPVIAGNNGWTPGHADFEGTRWNGDPILRSFNLGTLSEFVLVKASACVKISSKKISFEAASIIGCGVVTGYGSLIYAAKFKSGSSVLILGSGGVGLNIVQSARIAGASKIIVVDIHERRLEMAKKFGATHTIVSQKDDFEMLDVIDKVKELTFNRGADYAFECTAIPELGAIPLAMIKNAGTVVQVSGIEKQIYFNMELFEWDKTYINPLYGQCKPQVDFPNIMDLYDKGLYLLDEMISQTYSLNELQKAFDDMLSGKNAKGVILFD